jgi:hypothetical protein
MTMRRSTLLTTAARVSIAATAVMCALFWGREAFAKDEPRLAMLRAAELARFEANVSADAKVLGELLDDALEYAHSNGELDSKQSFIDSLTTGKRDYASTKADIETIRILGDVAIIRGKAKVTVIEQGGARDLHIGYTDVWLWKDGKWRMTAWRSARLPD